jgi:D-amino-acid dehydrogenase
VTNYRNTEIQGFETSGNSVVGIRTSNELWKADQIVLASGALSRLLAQKLGIKMSLQAGKGYSITFRNPKVKPTRPYILTQGRVAVTPFSDSLRFAGTMEIAGIDLSITQPRVEAILDAIPKYFGNVERPSSASAEVWAGLRPVTPDGLPYVGRLRNYPNLIAATGHAMLGISLAPVTGKLVAEVIAGQQPSHDLTLLDPNRYH